MNVNALSLVIPKCKTVGEKQCKTVQTQLFQLFNYWNEKNYGRSAGGKTTEFSVPFQMFEKILNRQHKVCKCDSQQWIKSAYINIFWRIKIISWEIFTFWGQIYHFYGSFITLGWPLHFIKSTRKILAWVSPPPFWQCQDLESALYVNSSQTGTRWFLPADNLFQPQCRSRVRSTSSQICVCLAQKQQEKGPNRFHVFVSLEVAAVLVCFVKNHSFQWNNEQWRKLSDCTYIG